MCVLENVLVVFP